MPMLRSAHRIGRELGDAWGIQSGLMFMGRAVLAMGRPSTAATVMSRAVALGEETGAVMGQEQDQIIEAIRFQLDQTAFAEAWQKGRQMTVDEAVELALRAAEPAG